MSDVLSWLTSPTAYGQGISEDLRGQLGQEDPNWWADYARSVGADFAGAATPLDLATLATLPFSATASAATRGGQALLGVDALIGGLEGVQGLREGDPLRAGLGAVGAIIPGLQGMRGAARGAAALPNVTDIPGIKPPDAWDIPAFRASETGDVPAFALDPDQLFKLGKEAETKRTAVLQTLLEDDYGTYKSLRDRQLIPEQSTSATQEMRTFIKNLETKYPNIEPELQKAENIMMDRIAPGEVTAFKEAATELDFASPKRLGASLRKDVELLQDTGEDVAQLMPEQRRALAKIHRAQRGATEQQWDFREVLEEAEGYRAQPLLGDVQQLGNISPEVAELSTKVPNWFDRYIRSGQTFLRKMGPAGEEVSNRLRSFEQDYHLFAGPHLDRFNEVARKLSDEEAETVVKLLKGETGISTNPNIEAAAGELRSVMDEIRTSSQNFGFSPGEIKDTYFPRIRKDEEVAYYSIGHEPTRTSGSILERKRIAPDEEPGKYINTLDAVKKYIIRADKDIAIAKNFGHKAPGDNFGEFLRKIRIVKKGDLDRTQDLIKRITATHEEALRGSTKSLRNLRYLAGLGKLYKAGASQFSQLAPVAAHGGIGKAAKYAAKAFRPKVGQFTDPDMLRSATRAGATESDLADIYGLSGEKLAGAVPKNWMWGIPTTDKYARTVGYHVGRDIATEAAQGSQKAVVKLQNAGIDYPIRTPMDVERAAREFANFTNRTASALELPAWMSSPGGRTATQFLGFPYSFGKYLMDSAKNMQKTGDISPLMRMAGAGTAVGAGVGLMREGIAESVTSVTGDPGRDVEPWEAARRGYISQVEDPLQFLIAAEQNIGGLGAPQLAFERLASDPSGFLGPVAQVGYRGAQAAGTGSPSEFLEAMIRNILPAGHQVARGIFGEAEGRGRRRRTRRRTS